jgi:hypothetical protein
MVRLALLAVVVSACLASAPAAEAVDLPVDLQSTAATAVGQVQAVAGGAAGTATQAAPPTTPQVNVDTTAPAVGAAADATRPAAEPAEYTTAAAVSVIDDGPRHTDRDLPVRSARFKQGHGHTGSGAAHGGHGDAALSRRPVGETVSTHVLRRAPHATAAAPKERPSAPDRTPPTSGGGAASAPAAGLSLGGLALLAVVICLAGPRLGRRLLIQPAGPRPVAFVALLERPG